MEDEVRLDGVVTCSTVSGEQISSPLRIMERWVNTSDSWKESRPSSSLTLLTTETNTHVDKHKYTNIDALLLYLDIVCVMQTIDISSHFYLCQTKELTYVL